jgi:glycerophosphoryl diester phosphodiesterase
MRPTRLTEGEKLRNIILRKKTMRYLTSLVFCAFVELSSGQTTFDIEGHRGCRGLYPENTVTAFIEAIKIGVNTLELDVVVSKDSQLVVSHEPWMSHVFCFTAEGKAIEDNKEKYNIYQLPYSEIQKFDCGINGHPKFPEQRKMSEHKPLLKDVIEAVEQYITAHKLAPVSYNIETKSTPDGDNKFHPAPDEFAGMLYDVLKAKNILSRSIIQSFDPRTLQVIHKTDSNVKTALLIGDANTFEKNLEQLGFVPAIYSPLYLLVNKKLIKKCHTKGILIIPWTVNEEKQMIKLKAMGVDGLITDYPNRAVKVLR